MKIALLGFDRQGKSAFEYWLKTENEITICDRKEKLDNPPIQAKLQLGDGYLENLGDYDLLVRTPGLHPQQILDANPDAPLLEDKITTVTNEFMRVCPTKNIIGVTGTKGKGTTSTIIAEMLRADGKRVHLGGNIGIPPLDLLKGVGRIDREDSDTTQLILQDDWVVLELANYQLIDMQHSPHIAVCLMITPEHLDWHSSLDEYLRAKQQIFAHQAERDIAIYKAGDNRSMHLATTSLGKHIPYLEAPGAFVKNDAVWMQDQKICDTEDVGLLGEHNLENVCAAVTVVWQATQNISSIAKGIKNTRSLPFRIEKRCTINGVTYYNDSFATNPGATIAAIKAVRGPKIMLLGGFDRGLDFSSLAKEIADKANCVKHAIIFGAAGNRIKQALDKCNYSNVTVIDRKKLDEVVLAAQSVAEKNDAIIFSPACASFDMFKNFEERGKEFNRLLENNETLR